MSYTNDKSISFFDKDGEKIDVRINNDYNEESKKGKSVKLAMSNRSVGNVDLNNMEAANNWQTKLAYMYNKYNGEVITENDYNKILYIASKVEEEDLINRVGDHTEKDYGDMQEKGIAFAFFKDLSPQRAEDWMTGNGDQWSVGEEEYLVLTDEEAEKAAIEYEVQTLEDTGIEGINVNIEDYVNTDWFDAVMNESNESYVYEIEDEKSDKFENRLIEELYDRGIIDDDDFEEDEDGDPDYFKLKESVDLENAKEEMKEKMNNEYRNGIEWYQENYGDTEFNDVVKEKGLVEYEALAEHIISMDGRGNALNSYDGVEYEAEANGITYYIYNL